MKIAFIIHRYPHLYINFITYEIIELIRKGHEIYIFSIHINNKKIINNDIYKIRNNIFYFKQFRNLKEKILLKCNKFFNKKNNKDYLNNKIYLSIIKKISKKIIDLKIDVIHAAFANAPATFGLMISNNTGIPFSFECHAFDLFVNFKYVKEKIQNASKIFVISEYNKKYLIEKYNCDSSKIILKRVNFNKNHCDSVSTIKRNYNLILSVCRLRKIKGLEYGIEAFHKLYNNGYKDFKYIIIGDGPLKKKLKKLIKKYNLVNNVIFTGELPNHEVLYYMTKATIFIHPSIETENNDKDGIPTALIEAMYLKTPVISTYVSGIPELIDNNQNGILVNQKNSMELYKQIKYLIENKEIRERLSKQAKNKIINKFNINKNMNILIKNFEDIIK